jgi:uncharacterized protein (TIGR03435 family)
MRSFYVAAIATAAAGVVVTAHPSADARGGLKAVQTQTTDTLPAFEAASIKPSDPAAQGQFVRRQPGGRFSTSNMPLRALVGIAYQLQDFQLDNVPDWAGSERYDITAKFPGDPPPTPPGTADDMMLALRHLLADRFNLRVHLDAKDLPIYALVRSRPDRLGAHLEKSTLDCQALMQGQLAAARAGGPPPQPPPPDASGRPACGIRGGFGTLAGNGFPLSQLANVLSQLLRRTVVDRTGLEGAWAFDLKFTPDSSQLPPGAPPPGVNIPAPDPDSPSIFTAVEEQLGLKLDSTRGPVDVLVVDRLERPTVD